MSRRVIDRCIGGSSLTRQQPQIRKNKKQGRWAMAQSTGKATRRGLLQGGAAAIAAAYGLHPRWAEAEIPLEYDGSKFQMTTPEPNPKRGGVMRYGIPNRPPHFDVPQSGTI